MEYYAAINSEGAVPYELSGYVVTCKKKNRRKHSVCSGMTLGLRKDNMYVCIYSLMYTLYTIYIYYVYIYLYTYEDILNCT
jgi:hypothetical protein